MKMKQDYKNQIDFIKASGYTLTELLIYMFLASIVILLALSLMRTSFKNYTVDSRKSEIQEIGRDALNMMLRDIANTGLKRFIFKSPGNPDLLFSIPGTTVGGGDLSSFNFWSGNPGDILEIYKTTLDANGQNPIVDRIQYNLSGNVLKRVRMSVNPAEELTLATNVEALQFQLYNIATKSWVNTVATADKVFIKEIRVFLLLKIDSGTPVKHPTSYPVADITITASATDGYIRRLYQGEMEVENNGL